MAGGMGIGITAALMQEISEPVLLRDIVDQDKFSSLDRLGLKIMPKNQLVVFVHGRNEPYPEIPEFGINVAWRFRLDSETTRLDKFRFHLAGIFFRTRRLPALFTPEIQISAPIIPMKPMALIDIPPRK